jgi:hypothetical protein
LQFRAGKTRPLKIGAGEVGFPEISQLQLGSGEIRATEVGATQVRPEQVRPGEVDPRAARLALDSATVDLRLGKDATGGAKGQERRQGHA